MKTQHTYFRIKLAAGLTLGISCLLYAAAVFIPTKSSLPWNASWKI